MGDGAFVPLCKAAKDLGVDRMTLSRLVNAGTLTVYRSQLDRRQKLLSVADLDRLRVPQAKERLVA
jgi:hypothetical protein